MKELFRDSLLGGAHRNLALPCLLRSGASASAGVACIAIAEQGKAMPTANHRNRTNFVLFFPKATALQKV